MSLDLEPVAWMVHNGEIWNTPTSPYNDERGEPLYSHAQLIAAQVKVLREAAEIVEEGTGQPMQYEALRNIKLDRDRISGKLRRMADELENT